MADSLQLVWDLIARDNASGTFRKVGAEAEGASGAVGKLVGGFTALAVGGAVAASVKAASDFQAKMLLIQTQSGATRAEVEKMSPAILSLAGQVAQAPEALATSLYHVESTGLRGAQALDAVRVAAEGAKVGHADLEETTNALTATIASGMLPATETYAQAMGQLNTIVGSGDMKMQDLNEALGTGLLVTMKQYGVTIPDVGAALADFGDNNIRGADAATKLRMAVQALESPSKTGAAALKTMGITQKELADDMAKGGLNKALTDLHQHLLDSGVSADKWGQILTDAFTKKAGAGVLTLIGTFDRFQSKYQEVSKGANSFGDAWAATTKTASFQFGQLKDTVDAVGIRIGTGLLPALGNFSSWLASVGIPAAERFWASLQQFEQSHGFQMFLADVEKVGGEAWQVVQSLAGGLKDLGSSVLPPVISAGGDLVHMFSELPGQLQLSIAAFAAFRIAAGRGVFDDLASGAGTARTAVKNLGSDMSISFGAAKQSQIDLTNSIDTGRKFAVSAAGVAEQQSALTGTAVQKISANLAGLGGAAGAAAEKGLGALKSAGQGVMNMLGGPWGAALAGATLLVGLETSAVQAAKEKQDDWTAALKAGGSAMEQAQSEMSKTAAAQQQVGSGVEGFFTTIFGYKSTFDAMTPSVQSATDAYKKWYDSLGLVDQKSQDVSLAVANLNEVEKNHASDSLAVQEAVDRVRRAQEDQKVATDELNQSTKTSVQLSQEQANALLALTGSSLAVKQSYDEFQSSYQQLLSDQAKGQLSTAQLTNEQDALNSSALNVATSAGTAGAAWAKANGVTDTATASQYAQLLALEKVANAMGSNTPAAVSTLIQSLQASVAQGHLTAGQMDAITTAVDGIPGQKNVDVTADTSQAQNQINALLGMYQHVQYTGSAIVVNGRVVANADGNLLEAYASGGMRPMSSSVAQVVQPGTLRVIGDNPVSAEAFIPLNHSPRSQQILSEAASRMGFGLHAMADGGIADRFWAQPSQSMLDSLKATAQAAAAAFSGGSSSGGNAANRALGQSIANAMGVGGQFSAIDYVFTRESGWNNNAQNPTSTAYGIPQFLASTWAQYGGKTSDPATQIRDGILYMENRYGSPNGAAAFWQGHHWYKDGTNYVPSDQLAVLHKGEAVVPASKNQGAPFQGGGPVQITGTLRIDGDGLAHIVDGRIADTLTATHDRAAY